MLFFPFFTLIVVCQQTDATPRDLTVGVALGIKRLLYLIIGYWNADNLYFFQIPQRTAEYSRPCWRFVFWLCFMLICVFVQ